MCECKLLVDGKTDALIEVPSASYAFEFSTGTKTHVLLRKIPMHGLIDYAAAHEIKDSHGVSHGYMFIVGKAAPSGAAIGTNTEQLPNTVPN